ncbi:MAG: hypothetical protein HMLKMBBP_03524 [Planctomycetes bacterium]|nr:hypothetical protein [Planctomycetota bacterium]
MRTRRLVLLAVPLALTACGLLQVLLLPFQLIFSGLSALGSGIGSLLGAGCTVESVEGPMPETMTLADGRFVVRPSRDEPSRFRVTVTAPGHASETYDWPDDFASMATPDGRAVEIRCFLAAEAAPR